MPAPRRDPLPVVPHYHADPAPGEVKSAERLAEAIRRERPELCLPDDFRALVPARIEAGPTLHLDDLSAIAYFWDHQQDCFPQERARLRALDGDVVATSLPVAQGYEDYCRDQLGLGSVEWLHPASLHHPQSIAEACWRDERVRRRLVTRIKSGELEFLHPHMGTLPVWELAALLGEQSGRPLKVVAPPPQVALWANNKLAFADVVRRLFGEALLPRTMSACNFALLAERVKSLAGESSSIGVKVPNSAGGDRVLILESAQFLDQSLDAVRSRLKQLLADMHWSGESELLVDRWESGILCSPSAQLWIPPEAEAGPIVEGLFAQSFSARMTEFAGSRPAELPSALSSEIVNRCWLVARLIQRLGYVGRCSFDLILVGPSLDDCRLEFVECNGRWGGTSTPMTLMNRLFGDWAVQPYASAVCSLAGLEGLDFRELLQRLGGDLFDRRRRTGSIILSAPGRLARRSAIDAIGLGTTLDEASEAVERRFTEMVRAERDGKTIAT
jgi:hypothetical protein